MKPDLVAETIVDLAKRFPRMFGILYKTGTLTFLTFVPSTVGSSYFSTVYMYIVWPMPSTRHLIILPMLNLL